MSDQPIFSAYVKATDKLVGPPKPSLEWARSRRARMCIFHNRVVIGNWTFLHDEVTEATMYQTAGGIKARVLEIVTSKKTVQINFNPGTDPTPHLPYKVVLGEYPQYLQVYRNFFWALMIPVILAMLLL